jgi:hypothetical protein
MNRNTLVAEGAASRGFRLLRALQDRKKNYHSSWPLAQGADRVGESVKANLKFLPGQFKMVTFTVPDTVAHSHGKETA